MQTIQKINAAGQRQIIGGVNMIKTPYPVFCISGCYWDPYYGWIVG